MSEFEKGAWMAFNEVLGWISFQDQKLIDKEDLHRTVSDMRPTKSFVVKGDRILLAIAAVCGVGGFVVALPDASRPLWLFSAVLGGVGSGVSLGAYFWLPQRGV